MTSVEISLMKCTRSVLEAQKSQDVANADASGVVLNVMEKRHPVKWWC